MKTKTIRLTASGAVCGGECWLEGLWVNSGTSFNGVKLWDNTAASGYVLNSNTTPAVAQFHSMAGQHGTIGIYATLTGTADVTFFVRESDN